jgi:hypothetical protein
MNSKILLIGLILMSLSLSAQSTQRQFWIGQAIEAETNPQYTLVYFAEAWDFTRLIVTHPDRKIDNSEMRFKKKDAHLVGSFDKLMPVLNKLSADGFKVISHSVSTRVVEGSTDSWHYVYALEKAGA